MRQIVLAFICCCLLAIGAGCSDISLATRPAAPPDRELQWPPLPMPSRIAWVKEIGSYHDLGIAKGFWQRVVDFVAGEGAAGFGKPYGVYADDRERLFVVDVGLAEVHVLDQKEKLYSVIGGGKTPAFRTPIAVTEDDANNLYITDAGTGVIYRYGLGNKKLERLTRFTLGRPTGIAFNRQNRLLYVSDTASHQVVVIDLAGNERMRIGERGTGQGQFNYPTDLVVDRQGWLYVTDALNARVQVFSSQGRFKNSIGKAGDTPGSFAKPKGVAVDSEGHIYVCDAMFDAVQIFNQAGRVLLDFGTHGAGPGQFWMPSGLFIDRNDYIYVSDSYNRRIQVFKYLKVDEPVTKASAGNN